jgi:putative phage-type endonuclease
MRKKNISTTRVDMETQTDLTLSDMDIILKLISDNQFEMNKTKKEEIDVVDQVDQVDQVDEKEHKEKIDKIKKMKRKIEYLESVYQPEQRTDEWYQHRHGLITASSVWKVFGTQSTQNQLIYEKCSPIDAEKYNKVNTESPLHWGQKYEQLSKDLYEMLNCTKIQEFGCIKHPNPAYYFIGASPDGINVCPLSRLYGRMLEIKNVVSREITGIPKEDYWIQMQIQMEVCRLPECDFLETKFVEYEDESAFNADSTETNDETNWNFTLDGKRRGVIVYFIKDDKPFYQYAPLKITTKVEFDQWFEKTIHAYDSITWIKNIYWRLEVYSCVLVLRDKEWFKKAVVKIEALWKIVEAEKVTGYEHRAPKRRVVKKNDKKNDIKNVKKNDIKNDKKNDKKNDTTDSNKNEATQVQTKIELNEDGTFAPVSFTYEKKCHSGLFF